MKPVKKMTVTAVCTALCLVLPMAFHSMPGGGNIFLPMHIPVLLCGMLCGWPYGGVCGILGPLLSGALTGMPAAAVLPGMMAECSIYGISAGWMMEKVHTGKLYRDLYVAQITAMLAGRIFGGIAKGLIFAPGLTLTAWAAASFVTALPGIALQLLFLPCVVATLMKARVIPGRYA